MPWFSLHEAISKDTKGGAWQTAASCSVPGKRVSAGRTVPRLAACYGTKNGPASCNIELTPPPDLTELKPGDFVEATVELLVLPQFAKDYYGPNEALRRDLAAHGNTWKPVLRQAAQGALAVSVSKGDLLQSYPVRIEVGSSQAAEFTVTGGVGYCPITFTGLRDYRGWKLHRWASDKWAAIDQSVFGNDFWQVHADADGRFAITFNVLLDGGSGCAAIQIFKRRMSLGAMGDSTGNLAIAVYNHICV